MWSCWCLSQFNKHKQQSQSLRRHSSVHVYILPDYLVYLYLPPSWCLSPVLFILSLSFFIFAAHTPTELMRSCLFCELHTGHFCDGCAGTRPNQDTGRLFAGACWFRLTLFYTQTQHASQHWAHCEPPPPPDPTVVSVYGLRAPLTPYSPSPSVLLNYTNSVISKVISPLRRLRSPQRQMLLKTISPLKESWVSRQRDEEGGGGGTGQSLQEFIGRNQLTYKTNPTSIITYDAVMVLIKINKKAALITLNTDAF